MPARPAAAARPRIGQQVEEPMRPCRRSRIRRNSLSRASRAQLFAFIVECALGGRCREFRRRAGIRQRRPSSTSEIYRRCKRPCRIPRSRGHKSPPATQTRTIVDLRVSRNKFWPAASGDVQHRATNQRRTGHIFWETRVQRRQRTVMACGCSCTAIDPALSHAFANTEWCSDGHGAVKRPSRGCALL